MSSRSPPAVWLPTVRAGSGTDSFAHLLAAGLSERGIRAEITWLPHRAEYLPWTVRAPGAPKWANVVHVNSWLPERFVPRGLPILATVHHCVQDPILTPYKSVMQKLYHRFHVTPTERRIVTHAATVTAVSAYTALQVQRIFGVEGVVVVPNGVDTDTFSPAGKRPAPTAPFRLLFVGSWSRRKGTDLLSPIMQALGPEFELWIVSRAARGLPPSRLPGNVRMAAPQPTPRDLAAVYRQCDALLLPSRLEGFGLVALEAQACGLPVIATDGSSLPEVVEDERTGLLCRQDDVAAFAAAARRLREHPSFYASLAEAARSHAASHFSIDRMVAAYLRLYRQLLTGPPHTLVRQRGNTSH